MNYEIHGNTIPHFHICTSSHAPLTTSMSATRTSRARFMRTDEDIARMRKAVRGELSARLLA